MPDPLPHPVTVTFLSQCINCYANDDGSVTPLLWPGVTLWPRINESGAWAFGVASGITMSATTLVELQGATGANADGGYETAAGTRVLVLTSAGACEPSGPPPPAP